MINVIEFLTVNYKLKKLNKEVEKKLAKLWKRYIATVKNDKGNEEKRKYIEKKVEDLDKYYDYSISKMHISHNLNEYILRHTDIRKGFYLTLAIHDLLYEINRSE